MPAFVAELVRTRPTQSKKSPPLEVKRMLHRAIVSIRDLRESLGIPGSGTTADEIIGLFAAATDSEVLEDAARAAALLKAADMLRTLRVATNEGARVWVCEPVPIS